jgi:peptidoglycan/LPS O-acetylase OafA/YrhL
MVSGFDMGLVLDTTSANSTASFYASRLLRLGPTYLVAVTLSFLTALLTAQLFNSTSRDCAEFPIDLTGAGKQNVERPSRCRYRHQQRLERRVT